MNIELEIKKKELEKEKEELTNEFNIICNKLKDYMGKYYNKNNPYYYGTQLKDINAIIEFKNTLNGIMHSYKISEDKLYYAKPIKKELKYYNDRINDDCQYYEEIIYDNYRELEGDDYEIRKYYEEEINYYRELYIKELATIKSSQRFTRIKRKLEKDYKEKNNYNDYVTKLLKLGGELNKVIFELDKIKN